MTRILFIVNGLGLGNSTRCDAIIQRLVARNIRVDIATSDNGIEYFQHCPYVSAVHRLRSFYYCRGAGGKLSVWRTLFALPDFARIFAANIRQLSTLLAEQAYAAVVIDSDYTLLGLRGRIRVPVIAINNADVVIQECRKLPELPASIRTQYLIERCDDWFHRRIPDLVLSPSILPGPDGGGVFKHLSPPIRAGLTVRPTTPHLRRIVVMLSGSRFGSTVDFLHGLTLAHADGVTIDVVGREGCSDARITYHGKLFRNHDIINRADMLVVNGGFSAVSEAVVLRKPAVVIPIENHAEQFINAVTVERMGLGLMASRETVVAKIQEMACHFPSFVEAHDRFRCSADGAQEAARWIAALAQDHRAPSADALPRRAARRRLRSKPKAPVGVAPP